MLAQYYRFNKVGGINIQIHKDGSTVFSACLLTVSGNQLNIDQKITSLTDVNDLKKHFPAKTIVALNLSGKGVLIKQVDKAEPGEELNFSKLLPNAKAEDFYTQVFSPANQSFVAFVRQSEADRWINIFKSLDFIPVIFSLGPFTVSHIVPQLNVYDGEIIFDGHTIHRDEQQNWTGYKYDDKALSVYPLKLENEKIDEALLIPYASAFQAVLYPNVSVIDTNVSALKDELKHRAEQIRFKVNGAVVLLGIFILLLINFLLFSYYNTANQKLASQLGQTSQLASNAASLSDSLKARQQLLNVLGWEGKADKSVMIDQIAQVLPSEVKWEQVAVDPLIPNPDHGSNKDVFTERQIKITGTSERLIPVNEWIARLKTKTWVKDVQLQNYYFNNELNTGMFVVTINY